MFAVDNYMGSMISPGSKLGLANPLQKVTNENAKNNPEAIVESGSDRIPWLAYSHSVRLRD